MRTNSFLFSDPTQQSQTQSNQAPQPFFFKSVASVQTWPLLEGAAGTFQALELMAAAVRGECAPDFSGYADPYNIARANAIVSAAGAQSEAEKAAALFAYCRDHIAYVNHPWNVQQVQDCRRTLEMMTGDCVSKSVCLSTLLAGQGIISRFVAQAPRASEFDHVYVEALLDGAWIGLDPVASGTEGRPFGGVGWRQALPDFGFETTQEIFHA